MAYDQTTYLGYGGSSAYDDEERRRRELQSLLDSRGGLGASTPPAQVPVQPDPEPPVAQPEQTPPGDSREDLSGHSEQTRALPRSPTMPAGTPDRDVQLEQARRDAEMNALRNANFDRGSYGVGEFARDNGAALLASILDIGFNKGRGLGAIVGTTANEVSKQEAARLQRAKDAAAAAHQIRTAGENPYQWAALEERKRRNTLTAEGQKAVQGRYDTTRNDKIDPNSQARNTERQMAYDRAARGTAGRLDTEHDLNPRTAGDKAQIAGAEAGARTSATINTEAGLAPTSAATAGTIAAGREQGSVEGRRAGMAANRPLQPGFVETDPGLRASYADNPEGLDKMNGDMFTTRQLGEASRKIAALRAQNGPNFIPDVNSGEYDALRGAVVGAYNRIIAQGGVLNEGERKYIEQLVPGSRANFKDLAGWITGNDVNAQQLEGFARGLESVMNSRMAGYGVRYDPERAQQQAPPSAAPAMPQRPSARARRPVSYAPAQPGGLGAPQPLPPVPTPDNFMERYQQYRRQREAQP